MNKIFERVRESLKSIKIRTISVLAIAVLIIVIASSFIFKEENVTKKQEVNSSELARAMTYDRVEEGDESTNSEYVNFDAFFLRDLDGDGYAEGVRGTCRQIGKQDTLYMDIKVQGRGYLKNGKILINSKNAYLEAAIPKDVDVKENAIGSNIKQIVFNDLETGTQRLFTGVVKSGNYSYSTSKADALLNNINNYSQINSVTLTGVHVAPDGTETLIEKTVEFNIDWYATVEANFTKTVQEKDVKDMVDEENDEINLQFDVELKEIKNDAFVNKAQIELDIPKLNDYDAIRVDVKDANFEYDMATKKLVATREAIVDSNGKIIKNAYVLTNGVRITRFNVTVTYPLEAYKSMGTDSVELQFKPKAFYEGFNNPNEEFDNPYKSKIITNLFSIIFNNMTKEEGSRLDVYVGKYVYNPVRYVVSKDNALKIYNGISTTTTETYEVLWRANNGYYAENKVCKTTIRNEGSDILVKNDGTEISMENMVSNAGIYFSNYKAGLYEDNGYIKVYNNDTDELIETFTKENWSKYTKINPYKYSEPIEHIRIETSEIKPRSQITIHNVKELNSEYIAENYSLEEFNSFSQIKSNAICDINDIPFCQTTHTAYYEASSSLAKLVMERTSFSTQSTEENVEIKIVTETSASDNREKWINGAFLLKMPKEIIDLEINDVTINNSSVSIISWESYVEDGCTFVKIITENDAPTSYEIVINCNMTPDPRLVSTSKEIELYASNENCENYSSRGEDIYDINGNLNIKEYVNKTGLTLNLVSPGTLLTNQIATNYDEKGSIAIAPQNAIVEKNQRKAKIELEIKNGYENTISEIFVLGKIPFKGNTYTISKGDMNSEFDTRMTDAGIQIPEELHGKTTVYYTDVEQPSKDITDSKNRWTTSPADWSKIKAYLIVLENYSMVTGETHKFTYEIEIPEALNYNEVSYSHHGIYFSLDTEEGKYRTYVEPNKLGFMIARQFDLEITKYQKDSERLVGQATYSIIEEGAEEGKARVTDNDGKIILKNLFVDKTYIIREIKTSNQYELNSDEIKFRTSVNAEGKIEPVLISGTLKKATNIVVKESDAGYVVALAVEDKVRPNLKVTAQELGTGRKLNNIRYMLTGKGMPESGKSIITDLNGELTIAGLYIDEEYVLQETKAEGYYVSKVKFVIRNNNGVYQAVINEGTVNENRVELVDEIPTINFILEKEKIPTYTLDITKAIKGESEKFLVGAKFRLLKDGKALGEYISDENGKIVISNLYQYVDGKDLDCTYILKETYAPAGYAKVKDIVFKVQKVDGGLEFQEELSAGQTAKNYTSEGDVVHLVIEDSPSFKLVKKDGTTAEVLPGVKFAIYNVDNGDIPARDSKGNIIGTKETINGREYYVVVTNENGEITADLPEGLYKAIEVEADDRYVLKDNEYYFGIGASREALKTLDVELYDKYGGINYDYLRSISETIDGGLVVGGFFRDVITLTNGEKLTSRGAEDGIVIKYDKDGNIQWYKQIGGFGTEMIEAVQGTSDGGIIVGSRMSRQITLENGYTTKTNGLVLIKYTLTGEIEWFKDIPNGEHNYIKSISETDNREIIIGVTFYGAGSVTLENGDALYAGREYDSAIIKYSKNGELLWHKHLVTTFGTSNVYSLCGTSDGGIAFAGQFSSEYNLSDDVQLVSDRNDGIVAKYSKTGELEWYKHIGGNGDNEMYSIIETSDGGILVGGVFRSTITLDDENVLSSKGDSDGLILKYSKDGELEWYKQVGTSGSDTIRSVIQSVDGGILVGGSFRNVLTFGDKNVLSPYDTDGMILKYSESGEELWAKQITGVGDIGVYSLVEMENGDILVGGEFTNNIILADGSKAEVATKNGKTDGIILKLVWKETAEIIPKKVMSIGGVNADSFQTVVGTSDGGIVAGGTFRNSITLDDDTVVPTVNGNNEYGLIVKYGNDSKIEWYKQLKTNGSQIKSIVETSDGGILVGGKFSSQYYNDGWFILENGDKITSGTQTNGIIFKYSESGEFEWYKQIKGNNNAILSLATTADDGFLIGGEFNGSITLDNGEVLTSVGDCDGIILKYDKSGDLEYYKRLQDSAYDTICSVAETADGGIVAGGYFRESLILENGDRITVTGGGYAGLILKYDKNGKLEWYKQVGGAGVYDYIYSVGATSDGGVIAGGTFKLNIVLDNGDRVSGLDIDGIILKYDKNGNLEWHKEITERTADAVYSVKEASDGGILVGGKIGVYDSVKNQWPMRGLIAKYGSKGDLKWKYTTGSNINSVSETVDGSILLAGNYSGSIIGEKGENITSQGNEDAFIAKVQAEMGVPDVQELEVKNYLKEFKITTNIQQIDGVSGGTISGEGLTNFETIQYGGTSTKEIKIIPDEGYEIISITVNDEEHQFETLEDGSYIMPQFTNVTENKNIVVTYALANSKITINKIDSQTKERITGAKFKLDQLEERQNPKNVIGELTANGQKYVSADKTNEIIDSLGSLTNNGTQYFIEQSGKYVPTNSKTYQIANGGTEGIQNTTANSYIPIDLTNKEGKYVVVVNAESSSQTADYGYATVTETTTAPEYNSSTGRFVYISGTKVAKDYISMVLEGGKVYYLHLGYRKDGSVDTGNDQIVINSINLYQAIITNYNFIENAGKYESNNQSKDDTVANSYIPIDLTEYVGKYNLTVNAEIVSQSGGDYGYATVTENTTRPTYGNALGRFIYISGTQVAKDYNTVLNGGKIYYLHFGYYKNASISFGDDKFTINSINITTNDSELYHTEIETNLDGQAIIQVPFGKYKVTELVAPEGYWLNEEPTTIEFRQEGVKEFDIPNERKGKVTVHHYIKGTTTALAEDEISEYRPNDAYTTVPKVDFEKYELEKDENGEYIIPSNAVGTYTSEDIVVTYYYVKKSIPLVVKHYIEGTEMSVPLADGSLAEDEIYSGQEGEEYQTSSKENIDWKYKLVEEPENETGVYEYPEVNVIYYYRLKDYDIATEVKTHEETNVFGETVEVKGGSISGEGLASYENVIVEANSTKDIVVEAEEGYKIKSIKVQKISEDGTITEENVELEGDIRTYTLDKFTNVITDIKVIAEFEKLQGTVTVHHYIEGTTTRVTLSDGTEAPDEIKTGYVGDVYATKALESVKVKYRVVNEPDNSSGQYIYGNIEVIYYYKLREYNYTVEYYYNGEKDETVTETATAEYGTQITEYPQKIKDGYKFEKEENKPLTITENEANNVIKSYYIKRQDLTYIVNYLDKETNKVIKSPKVVVNQEFESIINAADEVIAIKEYNYDSCEKESITITTKESDNVINLYYTKRKEQIVINNVDRKTKELLVGAKFKISPDTDNVSIGNLVANGQEYSEGMDATKEITEVRGELTNNGEYYFVERDGKYIPTNGKTYQGSRGKGNTTANSYIKIDLSQKTGTYYVVVNARVSSQNLLDYGYATITETTSAPAYNSNSGRFIYISGTKSAEDYTAILEGGKTYYLHLGYRKDILIDSGEDQIEFNSIKVYGTKKSTYNFTENSGRYESNNQGKDNTIATSYIPIDLLDATREYELIVNAEISSQNGGDYGYAIITETPERPVYSSSEKFINISGTQSAQEYVTTLQSGKVYYLHLGYYKDGSTSAGEDKFTVNNIELKAKGDSESVIEVEINDAGKATVELTKGLYKITQLEAPEGYHLNEESVIIEVSEDGEHSVTIENDKKTKVIVNHYIAIKNEDGSYTYTEEKVIAKDGTEIQSEEKIGKEGFEYKSEAVSSEDLKAIYEVCVIPDNAIGIYTRDTIVVTYYYKLKEYNYKVEYYYNGEKDEKVTEIEKATYGTQIEEYISKIKDGYKFEKEENRPLTVTENEANNVISVYYIKRTDLSYKVNYLEKGTDKVLHTQKIQGNKEFESVINSEDERIDINGYNYDSVDKDTLTITTGENVMNIYYTKRTDLSYKVNYLEKDTNKVLSTQKVQNNMIFEDVVTPSDEVITIDGYNYDSVDKDSLTITTGENIINIYYTKRTDLSYKVNYLEKDTNKVLSTQKVVDSVTFEDIITSSDEVIDIDGYNYDSVDKETLTITTRENVINIYYVKRSDLSYKVNYLEKDTSKVLSTQKLQNNVTFESVVNSENEVIEIDGYIFDSADKDTLSITTGENVINLYYTKRTDLSYKVNYLEKDTNKVLKIAKEQDGMKFADAVKAEDEVIDIDGYNYDSNDKVVLIITTGENVINIYYTKRTDLSYKVNYVEKGTNKVLGTQKIVNDVTFEEVIISSDEIIDIDGYDYDSVDKDRLTITTGENVINIYYTKRTDLSYKVNYLEKDTNKVLNTQKVQNNMILESVVNTENEVIEIDGYNYDSVDKDSLTITTSENVINIYYTKRNDLSYKVNYLEKDTDKVLSTQKIVNDVTFEDTIKASDEVVDIDGYDYNSVNVDTLTIATGENIINIYYTKRNDLSYKVNYLEKDTNKVLSTQKVVNDVTFEDVIKASDEVVDIDGYNYDSVDKNNLTITIGENVINIYYTKRTDLSYKVNYLEKDTDKVLSTQKVQEGMTFEDVVISDNEVIEIDGYNYDAVDKDTLTITTGENVINIYYTKRNDLSYKVNYLEKGTGKVLSTQKVATNVTFEDVITSSDEVINIDGYSYDSVDKDELVITTSENAINIYYTKRTDLNYKVNYLEKDTNKVLSVQKVVNEVIFEEVIKSRDEVININGYNYDSVDKDTLTITTGENVINIYYIKRTDLSYKVNYLEKETNKVLSTQKVVGNIIFEDVINAENEVITIDGYIFDSSDKDTLTISTSENVINLYYTKRTDLSYKVNYLEKDTNKVLKMAKDQDGMKFADTVKAEDEIVEIDGYNYDSNDKVVLIITTGENVINIYYTKRVDLSYKVNYLEKDTDKVLSTQKDQDGMKFAEVVTSSNEIIDIDGYTYDSVDNPILVITTGENVINIYYVKRTDLSYKVNYLEKDTNKVLSAQKVVDNATFEDVITSSEEVIDIAGYDYNSVDKETLTITTSENVINIYYTKRTDLSYTVNYLEKDTNKVLKDQKVVDNVTFEDVIKASDEVVYIYGYNYDSANVDELVIATKDNVINLYYTKKDASVIVHHYVEGTTTKVANDVTVTGKVGDDYETTIAEDLPSKYELVQAPANATGTMTEDTIEVIYYYKLKATKVIVHHYEEGTTNKLSEDVEIEGLIDSEYTTEVATDIPVKYTLSQTPANATGVMTEEVIEVIYYYAVKDAELNIFYLEKNTDIELARPEKQTGKVGEMYRTDAKEIEGYTLVENSGNTTGQLEVEPLTVIYYYLQNTRATVQYINITTGEILDERTDEGLVGDEFVTETKTFDDYILVQEPEQKTVNMAKDEIILKYYYLHVSGGIIEEHIDIINNDVLYNEVHEGNEGDEYSIPSKEFTGYDLVEDRLPANSEGYMTVSPITVTYYYIHRAKVTTQYIDKTTGNRIEEDVVETGHEDDPYTTENKIFEGYRLIQVPENSNGNMTKEDIIVKYYYVPESAGVVERHLDVLTDEPLVEERNYYGYAEDNYETEAKQIPGYDLVKERYPENATGKMTKEEIVVTYYYARRVQVQVKYVDKITGQEIADTEVIDGHKGDNYTTEEKAISGYDLIEVPTNQKGIMFDDITEVIYYYIRPAKVITNYYDIDTKETIAAEEVIDGHEGDEYETVQKEIKYYNLVEMPQNAKGNMKAEDIMVNYYYKKKDFNLKVEKQVKEIAYNGQVLSINGNIGKVELDKSGLTSAEVVVTYEIKVTNTAELKGRAELIENIPNGMTMKEEENKTWVIHEDTAILSVEDLEPGQERSYNVIMRWNPSENNLGMKENIAEIVKVDNEAGFEEITIDDNKGKADLVISIKTGAEDNNTIVKLAILVIFIVLGITVTCIIVEEKNRK